ncbi:MAG: hypothetical protein KKG13_03435, partial [Nanoarchaeota archaeon]|nr:hypothetical protein [Nanoarchaeota archaeon]
LLYYFFGSEYSINLNTGTKSGSFPQQKGSGYTSSAVLYMSNYRDTNNNLIFRCKKRVWRQSL